MNVKSTGALDLADSGSDVNDHVRACHVCTMPKCCFVLLTFVLFKVCIRDACLPQTRQPPNKHSCCDGFSVIIVTHVLYVLQCLAGMASLGLFVRTKIIAAHTKTLYLFPFGRVMI